MNTQKNSFVSIAEQVAVLNKNAVEIITKLNDVVSSNSSAVEVDYIDEKGVESSYNLPTVGFLKKEIDIANNNIKRLSQFQDKSTYIVDGKSTKKVFQVDLNREPSKLEKVETVHEFEPINNWFFESLMNPMISVEINLSNMVEESVSKVLSRRYIVRFEKNDIGDYTTYGQRALDDFKSRFLNTNDIDINEFTEWYNNPTNIGIVGNNNIVTDDYDEQIFNFEYNELQNFGIFSIIKQEKDSLNKKLWYHFNTLSYYDKDGNDKTLSIGDQLILNKNNSTTRYKITEVNTSASNYRVSLERIEGYDPVPTGTNVLKYYSGVDLDKRAKVTVGFDEYCVVFFKPINGDNNVISSLWSEGVSFYTNDLVLSTDSNVDLSEYYLDTVNDYGSLLRDMVKKNIPSNQGLQPNVPVLNDNNFKVVQINKHITDTEDVRKVRDLHSQKNETKSRIEQLRNSVTLKNRELQQKSFKSVAERSKSRNELDKLTKELQNDTNLLKSVSKEITTTNIDKKIEPKYRIRGFWDIPQARQVEGHKPQEVVQFEVQYRYSSKTGKENTTEGYEIVTEDGQQEKTAYFSNWKPIKSDVRVRTYNSEKDRWEWVIEDVSDADTPNINQIDIPITKGEKVEIKVRSISEVGYPDAPLKSQWSDIITVEFPDELDNILNDNEFILQEASEDSLLVDFETSLETKGYSKHIEESFYVNEKYYAHTDKTIQTSFTDSEGNSLSLDEYLTVLTDKINSLEEIIKKSRGELQVVVFRNTEETLVDNGGEVNFTVECEDYADDAPSGTFREYQNNVYLIGDFYIRLDNVADENALGLLSDRDYIDNIENVFYQTDTHPAMISDNNKFFRQEDNQFIWFADTHGGSLLYNSGNTETVGNSPKKSPDALNTNNQNIGLQDGYDQTNPWSLIDGIDWTDYSGEFLTTVHPSVSSPDEYVEANKDQIKYVNPDESITIPINIYFKMAGNADDNVSVIPLGDDTHNKKLKVYFNHTADNKAFEFTINFELRRKKQITFTKRDTTKFNDYR